MLRFEIELDFCELLASLLEIFNGLVESLSESDGDFRSAMASERQTE